MHPLGCAVAFSAVILVLCIIYTGLPGPVEKTLFGKYFSTQIT